MPCEKTAIIVEFKKIFYISPDVNDMIIPVVTIADTRFRQFAAVFFTFDFAFPKICLFTSLG